jgi:amino acid transporter
MSSRSTPGSRLWPGVVVVLAGAALGYSMFAWRGAALFAGGGAAVAAVFGVIGPRGWRFAAAVALVLAALALRSASTLGWAGADVPDGTRYKASPVGLSHVLTPHQLTSRTEDCGWHSASGYAEPCAIASDGGAAFRRLTAVYPLVLFAVFLCVAGAVLSLRPARRLLAAQRVAAAGAVLVVLLAVVLFAGSVQAALAPLAGLAVGVGGTLGTMQLSAAVLLCLATCLSPRPHPAALPSHAG